MQFFFFANQCVGLSYLKIHLQKDFDYVSPFEPVKKSFVFSAFSIIISLSATITSSKRKMKLEITAGRVNFIDVLIVAIPN